jgi:hypothetical protein
MRELAQRVMIESLVDRAAVVLAPDPGQHVTLEAGTALRLRPGVSVRVTAVGAVCYSRASTVGSKPGVKLPRWSPA